MKSGAEQLQMTLRQRPNVGVAKNVILFVGDGMGVSTVTATRILMGQNEGYSGEEYRLHFEKMPYTGIVKVSVSGGLVPVLFYLCYGWNCRPPPPPPKKKTVKMPAD